MPKKMSKETYSTPKSAEQAAAKKGIKATGTKEMPSGRFVYVSEDTTPLENAGSQYIKREKLNQMIKDGHMEVESGNSNGPAGSSVTVKMSSGGKGSGKRMAFILENSKQFQNGCNKAMVEIQNKAAGAGVKLENGMVKTYSGKAYDVWTDQISKNIDIRSKKGHTVAGPTNNLEEAKKFADRSK